MDIDVDYTTDLTTLILTGNNLTEIDGSNNTYLMAFTVMGV